MKKTIKQWKKEFKTPIDVKKGVWEPYYRNKVALYFKDSDVRSMTEFEINKERIKEMEEKVNFEKEYIKACKKCNSALNSYDIILKRLNYKRKTDMIALESDIICIDIETTGLNIQTNVDLFRNVFNKRLYMSDLLSYYNSFSRRKIKTKDISADVQKGYTNYILNKENVFGDEILQISIIDGKGNVLMNKYIRPYFHKEWQDAEKINKISPNTLIEKNAIFFHEVISEVKEIIASCNTIIGYNINFDLSFLEKYGLDFSGKNIIDVMQMFSRIYGEWNDYYCDYKWQSLETCAYYYGYDFKPHDSLEDVKATLYCYEKIKSSDK